MSGVLPVSQQVLEAAQDEQALRVVVLGDLLKEPLRLTLAAELGFQVGDRASVGIVVESLEQLQALELVQMLCPWRWRNGSCEVTRSARIMRGHMISSWDHVRLHDQQ